jgi:hypothetical protein
MGTGWGRDGEGRGKGGGRGATRIGMGRGTGITRHAPDTHAGQPAAGCAGTSARHTAGLQHRQTHARAWPSYGHALPPCATSLGLRAAPRGVRQWIQPWPARQGDTTTKTRRIRTTTTGKGRGHRTHGRPWPPTHHTTPHACNNPEPLRHPPPPLGCGVPRTSPPTHLCSGNKRLQGL